MNLITTLILLAAALAMTLFAGWRGARPPDPRKGPRMTPWRFIMLLGAMMVFLLAIHLAAVLGVPMRSPV